MELTVEKSQELALQIEMMKPWITMIDVNYARAVVKSMRDQVNFQRSAAALNPNHDETQMELLLVQAESLDLLVGSIDLMIKATKLKVKIAEAGKARAEISKLFI